MTRRRYETRLTHRCCALRREGAAAACILALLFNLTAGIWLASRPVMGLEGSRTIWSLCLSGAGPASADVADGPTYGPADHPQCIFCLPLLSGAARTPDAATFMPLQREPAISRSCSTQTSTVHTVLPGRPVARGPPVAPADDTRRGVRAGHHAPARGREFHSGLTTLPD